MREFFINVLRAIGVVLSAPFFVGTTLAFFQQLYLLEVYDQCFIWGVVTYVVLHLFVYEPRAVFHFGRSILDGIFRFSTVFSDFLRFTVSVYVVLLLLGLFILENIAKIDPAWIQVMVFAVGLFATMHVILTAREMYEEDTALLKPRYFLVTGWVHVCVLVLVAVGLGATFKEFSLVEFFRSTAKITVGFYMDALTQLFAVKG